MRNLNSIGIFENQKTPELIPSQVKNVKSVKNTLNFLLNYFDRTRGVGHTRVATVGLQSENAYLVTMNEQVFKKIKKIAPFINYTNLDHIEKDLEKITAPLIFDNSAIVSLLLLCHNEISRLELLNEGKNLNEDDKDKKIIELTRLNSGLIDKLDQVNKIIENIIKK